MGFSNSGDIFQAVVDTIASGPIPVAHVEPQLHVGIGTRRLRERLRDECRQGHISLPRSVCCVIVDEVFCTSTRVSKEGGRREKPKFTPKKADIKTGQVSTLKPMEGKRGADFLEVQGHTGCLFD